MAKGGIIIYQLEKQTKKQNREEHGRIDAMIGSGSGSTFTEDWRKKNSSLFLGTRCYSQRICSSFPINVHTLLHNRQMMLLCDQIKGH